MHTVLTSLLHWHTYLRRLDCVRDDAGTNRHEGDEIIVTTSDGQRASTTASAAKPLSFW